jgi:hypothetical protein
LPPRAPKIVNFCGGRVRHETYGEIGIAAHDARRFTRLRVRR